MDPRSRASPEQFAALLDFMERNGDIARPQQGPLGRIKSDQLWQELTELLNSLGGGVIKSLNKWKKVWVDWKAKTKKKALVIRKAARSTGGHPSNRFSLTAFEHRVLAIMGLTVAIGLGGTEEAGFNEPPSQAYSLHQASQDADTNEIVLDVVHNNPREANSASTSVSSVLPIDPSILRVVPPRQRRPITPRLVSASPSPSTPRRQTLIRTHVRRESMPSFERATSEFIAIENRRLQLELEREKNNHQREMERLRLDFRRTEIEENQQQILRQLTEVLQELKQILSQLRPSPKS